MLEVILFIIALAGVAAILGGNKPGDKTLGTIIVACYIIRLFCR